MDPPRPQKGEMRALSADELARLLNGAREGDNEYLPFSLVHLVAFTGLRRSELLGLTWADIDFDLARLQVVRTLHVVKGGRVVYDPPKSAKGKRSVSLSPAAVLQPRAHREAQETRMEAFGVELSPDMPVFSADGLIPLIPSTVSHVFSKLVKRIGLKGVGLHTLRHTHASLMLRQGIHPKVVQERLGHSTIAITLDVYSHVTASLQEAAALRFEEGLAAESPAPTLEVAGTVA